MTTTDKLALLLVKCKAAVHITVNGHRNVYMTAREQIVEWNQERDCPPNIEGELLEKMVELDTIIEIQFYPDTPIGFYSVYHYDLDAALTECLGCFQ